MESPYDSPIRSTWRRVDGKWSLSHREREGVSKQERRLWWEQQKRVLRADRAGVFRNSLFDWGRKTDLTPPQHVFRSRLDQFTLSSTIV